MKTKTNVKQDSPFKIALKTAILKTVSELKKDKVVAMGSKNFQMMVRPPYNVHEGQPKGTNCQFYYNQLFAECIVELGPKLKGFVMPQEGN